MADRFSAIPTVALDDERITHACLRVLSNLGRFTDKRGWCWPSLTTLEKLCRMRRDEICKHIKNLESWGYLKRQRRKNDARNLSTCYQVVFDFPAVLPSTAEPYYPSTADMDYPSTAEPYPNTTIEHPKDSIPPLPSVRPPQRGGNGHDRGTRLSEDWEPGDDGVEYARNLGLSDDAINDAYHAFMRYWLAKAGQQGRKVRWDLTWQTWVRTTNDRLREKAAREAAWRGRYDTRH